MSLFRHIRSRVGARNGFTLAEVLVGVGLFGVAVPVLLGGMLASYGILKKNSHQIAALNLARKKIEYVMNIQYGSLSTTNNAYTETNIPIDSNNRFRATVSVTVSNPAGTTRKLVTVNVRWTEQQRTFNVTLHTLVSQNSVT